MKERNAILWEQRFFPKLVGLRKFPKGSDTWGEMKRDKKKKQNQQPRLGVQWCGSSKCNGLCQVIAGSKR